MPASAWICSALGLCLLAALLSYPGGFGLTRTGRLEPVSIGKGYLLTAKWPADLARERKRDFLFSDESIVLEDGVSLARFDSSEKRISNAGHGRFQAGGGTVRFSTLDGKDSGGRVFALRSPLWSFPESLLLIVWALAVAVVAICLRVVFLEGVGPVVRHPAFRPCGILLAAGFLGGFFYAPSAFADALMLGLAVPLIWAVIIGMLAIAPGRVAFSTLVFMAIVPALAGAVYYGVNAASDTSFHVGGILPQSDAWIHFFQAAQIATRGTTEQVFNGRLLYPGMLAVLLDVAGLNLLAANLLMALLVMLALALTCPMVSRRVGGVGTAIYCLFFWCYFRAHGSGLVMTENLGLLLGTIGFGFLLIAVERRSAVSGFAAILSLALGLVARPGAMFVLPALVLAGGVLVWVTNRSRFRIWISVGTVVLGMVIILGSFAVNHLAIRMLTEGRSAPFGNFAFTLHGLLNDTKWSTSAEAFDWNTNLVMENNMQRLRKDPLSLVRGVARAYDEAWRKGFLFRFGDERRFAGAGTVLFLFGAVAWFFLPRWREDGWWIVPAVLGILASIPFAPPWDAGERPYAVTVPIQVFVAAMGAVVILRGFGLLARRLLPGSERIIVVPPAGPSSVFIGFAVLCLLLAVPIPLLRTLVGRQSPIPAGSPVLLRGSWKMVSEDSVTPPGAVSRADFCERLSVFQEAYPEKASELIPESGSFVLAIDWSKLEAITIPPVSGPTP